MIETNVCLPMLQLCPHTERDKNLTGGGGKKMMRATSAALNILRPRGKNPIPTL